MRTDTISPYQRCSTQVALRRMISRTRERNKKTEKQEKWRGETYRDGNAVFELGEGWFRAEGALGEEGRPGGRRQPELRGWPGALRALRALQRLQLLHPPPQRAEKAKGSPINLIGDETLVRIARVSGRKRRKTRYREKVSIDVGKPARDNYSVRYVEVEKHKWALPQVT